MIPAILVTDAAEQDINDATQWYERELHGLGSRFLDAVDVAFARIANNPQQFPFVYRDIRRILLRRFPYGIYFRLESNALVVIACFHGRRNPTTWKRRV